MAAEDIYGTAQSNRDKARQRGLAATEQLVGIAKEGSDRFERSSADRQRNIRSGTARGLAAAAPTGRMAAGGGMLGAFSQAGLDAEMAGIKQAQSDDREGLSLREGVAKAELGAAEFAASAGNEEEDFASAVSDGEALILQAINSNTNMIGNTSEEAVRIERDAIISRVMAQNKRAGRALRERWSPGGQRYNKYETSLD